MSKSIWPGVRKKKAKGKTYWYWTRVAVGSAWIRLPNPYDDADKFMREMARLQRVEKMRNDAVQTGTFGALVKTYRAHVEFTKKPASTQKTYNRYINRLLVAYADAPLVDLTPEDIQVRVMDGNQDTPGAANMMLSILRTLYKFARRRNSRLEDWTAGLTTYRGSIERQPWPKHVLDSALASEDELFRRAVTLALYTGQRPGDVCAMTWGAIEGDMIRVLQEKTREPMLISIHADLKAMLAQTPRSDRHLFILSNRDGAPLKLGVFRKWCKAHDPAIMVHGLRKNATNALFEAGCSAAEVSSITGHKSLKVLEMYGRKRDQAKMSVVATAKWGKKK